MAKDKNIPESASVCMARMNAGDQILRGLGIELVECRPGYGKAVMPLDSRQINGAGIAHGGAIFSLADITMAMAANAGGGLALTLNANISFFKAGEYGPFTAEAVEVSASSKIAAYEVSVTDARGELVAKLSGTAYKKHSQQL